MSDDAPWHAHIYYETEERGGAETLRMGFAEMLASGDGPILFVGRLSDRPVGPHPIPQFEIHFPESARGQIAKTIEASGLRALVHPLTDDDLADHTTLAHWIGEPLDLDVSVLDPPGENQGVARFGKGDF
ncbi:MAG: 4,5-dioxygenase [Sphingomonas bacterium]|nr:4,5-dioxygenase [Sphingomonas bacterium]